MMTFTIFKKCIYCYRQLLGKVELPFALFAMIVKLRELVPKSSKHSDTQTTRDLSVGFNITQGYPNHFVFLYGVNPKHSDAQITRDLGIALNQNTGIPKSLCVFVRG